MSEQKRFDMSCFTKGNKDDVKLAVDGLSIFCHSWCMNCRETEEKEDLVFRCKVCQFEMEDGRCSVKVFVGKHGTESQKESAFSMC